MDLSQRYRIGLIKFLTGFEATDFPTSSEAADDASTLNFGLEMVDVAIRDNWLKSNGCLIGSLWVAKV